MITGTVKYYNSVRGFGFIIPDAPLPHGRDLFVHASSLSQSGIKFLNEGQRVSCEVGGDGQKIFAHNITIQPAVTG